MWAGGTLRPGESLGLAVYGLVYPSCLVVYVDDLR